MFLTLYKGGLKLNLSKEDRLSGSKNDFEQQQQRVIKSLPSLRSFSWIIRQPPSYIKVSKIGQNYSEQAKNSWNMTKMFLKKSMISYKFGRFFSA